MYTRFRLGLEPIENISFNILRDDFLTNPEGTFAKYSSIEQRDGALKKHLLTCKKSSKELNEYIKSNSVSFSEEEILEFITASKCNLLYFNPGKEMLEKAAKLNLNEFVYYVIKGATYDRRNILFSINSIQSEETREKVLKALKISAEELTWLKNRLIPIGNIGAGSAFDIPIYDTISEMQRRNEIKKSFKAPKKSNR